LSIVSPEKEWCELNERREETEREVSSQMRMNLRPWLSLAASTLCPRVARRLLSITHLCIMKDMMGYDVEHPIIGGMWLTMTIKIKDSLVQVPQMTDSTMFWQIMPSGVISLTIANKYDLY
jgi:hypothetical protein